MAHDRLAGGDGRNDATLADLLAKLEQESFVDRFCGIVDPMNGGRILVGWRGEVPPSLHAAIEKWGLTTRLHFTQAPHLYRDMFRAGINATNRMARANINVVGFDLERNLDGVVIEYFSHGPEEDAKARDIAASVASQRSLPVRASPSSDLEDEGAAVDDLLRHGRADRGPRQSRLVPAALRYFDL